MAILGARRGGATACCLAIVALLALCHPASGDGVLMGQGRGPKDPVDVYVSIFLEKLLAVNEQTHQFTVSAIDLFGRTARVQRD